MDDGSDARIDAAIAWQQALIRDDADWDGFTRWLEADPHNREAFDEIAAIDAAVDAHRDALRITRAPSPEPAPRIARRWFLGGGIAAALAVSVGVSLFTGPAPQPSFYASSPGQTKAVTLAGGTRVSLSADSAIRVGGHAEEIALTRGAAFFDVPHDPGRTLAISAGGYRIADIGTRFAVDAGGGRVVIAVAEGSVTVTPPNGAPAALAAGQRLIGEGDAAPTVSAIAPDAVASWRKGRLVYDGAPLPVVAADISRYRGKPVIIDPALSDHRFSGVLVIGDGQQLVSDFAGVAGLVVERSGDRVVLRGQPS